MFGSSTMRRLGLAADNHGLTALDYARKSDDQEILELIQKIMNYEIIEHLSSIEIDGN